MLTLFLVGVIEMIVVSAWTNLVAKAKILASGAVTVVNILIWYYVLRTFIDDIANINLVLVYALGCAVGTIISTLVFKLIENKANQKQPSSLPGVSGQET